MPSVSQESPSMQSSRKRRRDDSDPQMHPAAHTPSGIPHQNDRAHQSSAPTSRKIIPLPPGKRQRTTVDIEVEAVGEPMQRSPSNSPQRHHHGHRDHQQTRDTSRIAETRSPSTSQNPATAPLMSRCHICSRKPNKKSDLDSFADCQGCGQRTCYVCIRECLGWGGGGPGSYADSPTTTTTATTTQTHPPASEEPSSVPAPSSRTAAATSTSIGSSAGEAAGDTSFTMLDVDDEDYQQAQHDAGERRQEQGWTTGGGHRRVVCSRCCVERGQDGEVACLGCLPFVEG